MLVIESCSCVLKSVREGRRVNSNVEMTIRGRVGQHRTAADDAADLYAI